MWLSRTARALALASAATAFPSLAGPPRVVGDGPDRLLVTVAAWAGWVLLCYLAVCLAVAAAVAARPRSNGLVRLLCRLAVPWLRRVLAGAAGASLAVGVLGLPAADAGVRHLAPHTHRFSFDWPRTPAARPRPAAAHPITAQPQRPPVVAPPPHVAAPRLGAAQPAGPGVARAVRVRSGDTLWSIAADHLRRPTAGTVAAAWPRWWSANRAVIGADPDLIHPGQRLLPPTRQRSGR